MILRLALRRLLPLLAVLSLALTPVAAPAAAGGLHAPMVQGHHAVVPADEGGAMPDRGSMPDRGGPNPTAAADHAAMDHHTAAALEGADPDPGMDDMPCCPRSGLAAADPLASASATHGCAKGCPLMALCLASLASLVPATILVPVPGASRVGPSWPVPASLPSRPGSPLPEPPRA